MNISHEHKSAATDERMTHSHPDPDNHHGYWERHYPDVSRAVAAGLLSVTGTNVDRVETTHSDLGD